MSNLTVHILLAITLLGASANQAQINATPIVYETSIEDELQKLEYGDVTEYMNKTLQHYTERAAIDYVTNLNSIMHNAKVEFKPEFSKKNFLILELRETESTASEQNFVLAWEKGNAAGGIVLEPWITGIEDLLMDRFLVVDAGTSPLRYKGLHDLEATKETAHIEGFSTTSSFFRVPNSTWLIYQSYPEDGACKLEIEPASNVRLYDTKSKLNVELYQAIDYTMWSFSPRKDDAYVFDIKKWTLDKNDHIVSNIVESIDFRKAKAKSIVQNKNSIIGKKQYFSLSNQDWSYMGCKVRYYILSDVEYYYECPKYTGSAKILEVWDAERFPKGTSSVVQIDSDEGTQYVFARTTGNRIEIIERKLLKDHTAKDKLLTMIEDKTIVIH